MVYLGIMHLLVFVILYYNAHHVQHGCDPAVDHAHALAANAVAAMVGAAEANLRGGLDHLSPAAMSLRAASP